MTFKGKDKLKTGVLTLKIGLSYLRSHFLYDLNFHTLDSWNLLSMVSNHNKKKQIKNILSGILII